MDKKTKNRVEALESYNLFDAIGDEFLDSVVGISAHICETPIALVSLLNDHKQFFVGNKGLEVNETPIEYAFCKLAIESDSESIFSITNAKEDDRVKENP